MLKQKKVKCLTSSEFMNTIFFSYLVHLREDRARIQRKPKSVNTTCCPIPLFCLLYNANNLKCRVCAKKKSFLCNHLKSVCQFEKEKHNYTTVQRLTRPQTLRFYACFIQGWTECFPVELIRISAGEKICWSFSFSFLLRSFCACLTHKLANSSFPVTSTWRF